MEGPALAFTVCEPAAGESNREGGWLLRPGCCDDVPPPGVSMGSRESRSPALLGVCEECERSHTHTHTTPHTGACRAGGDVAVNHALRSRSHCLAILHCHAACTAAGAQISPPLMRAFAARIRRFPCVSKLRAKNMEMCVSRGFHRMFEVSKSPSISAPLSSTDVVTGVIHYKPPAPCCSIQHYSISFQAAILQHNYIILLSHNPTRTHTRPHCCHCICQCLCFQVVFQPGVRFHIEFDASLRLLPSDYFLYSSVYSHKRPAQFTLMLGL